MTKMKDGKTASDVHSTLMNWLLGRGISILPPPQYFSRCAAWSALIVTQSPKLPIKKKQNCDVSFHANLPSEHAIVHLKGGNLN